MGPLGDDDPELRQMAAQGVDQLRTLTDESFTGAKQDRPTLLLRSLRVDKAHLGPLGRDHDRLGVRCIVLLAFH